MVRVTERVRAVWALREWDFVRVELSTTLAQPPCTTWIAEGRLWLSGKGSLMLGNDFVRHAAGDPSSSLIRVIDHKPMNIEERLARARALAAGQEYVAGERAETQAWMDKARNEDGGES